MLDFLHYIFGFQVWVFCITFLVFELNSFSFLLFLPFLRWLRKLKLCFDQNHSCEDVCFLLLMLKVYGCQKDSVSNQREHIVHLLANEQSQLRILEENEPVSQKILLLVSVLFSSILKICDGCSLCSSNHSGFTSFLIFFWLSYSLVAFEI